MSDDEQLDRDAEPVRLVDADLHRGRVGDGQDAAEGVEGERHGQLSQAQGVGAGVELAGRSGRIALAGAAGGAHERAQLRDPEGEQGVDVLCGGATRDADRRWRGRQEEAQQRQARRR